LVYIRSKAIQGISYASLVKIELDKRRGLSVQHTIKYLGRPESIASMIFLKNIEMTQKSYHFSLSMLPRSS
jgi:hypothetical protein